MSSLLAKLLATDFKAKIPGLKRTKVEMATGTCPRCGDIGTLHTRCTDCGCSEYLPQMRPIR